MCTELQTCCTPARAIGSMGFVMQRIAYMPDSFREVNGVAHTSRNFAAHAERHGVPMLCIHAAVSSPASMHRIPGITRTQQGSVALLQLTRSRLAVPMEQDLHFDPLFLRYGPVIERALREFSPDVIHITGPSELGIFGAWFAWRMKVPLVASWHTNVHEYAARRLRWLSRFTGSAVEDAMEAAVFNATSRFYRLARVLYAPNADLCAKLEAATSRPCHLMRRGVDATLFTPARRTRPLDERPFLLGFVGRLSVEKNVALLPLIDAALHARGIPVRWSIIGHGSEEAHLRAGLRQATFHGVLRDDTLADAYANLDALVFPSHTDTFGNVVLEALASGVPAIVTPDGGPATIVQDGITGSIVPDAAFAEALAALLQDAAALHSMRHAGRAYALTCSWDAIFDSVRAHYPTSSTHLADV
jgi:phosphatidylinositol alpha 1,6-mannosyltransferase